jgi:hypothetical protein
MTTVSIKVVHRTGNRLDAPVKRDKHTLFHSLNGRRSQQDPHSAEDAPKGFPDDAPHDRARLHPAVARGRTPRE